MKNVIKDSMANLTNKQVVNICNGEILGYVTDFIVDSCNGCLNAIIVPGESGFFNFKKSNDIIIPWDKIYKIGEDVILVELDKLNSSKCDCNK